MEPEKQAALKALSDQKDRFAKHWQEHVDPELGILSRLCQRGSFEYNKIMMFRHDIRSFLGDKADEDEMSNLF